MCPWGACSNAFYLHCLHSTPWHTIWRFKGIGQVPPMGPLCSADSAAVRPPWALPRHSIIVLRGLFVMSFSNSCSFHGVEAQRLCVYFLWRLVSRILCSFHLCSFSVSVQFLLLIVLFLMNSLFFSFVLWQPFQS